MDHWLTTAELAQIRSDIAGLFPDTADILSVSYTSDGAGYNTETWGTATAAAPCRIDYKTGREAVTGGAITPYHSAVISFAHNVTLTTANRVSINGNTFNVTAVNNGQSDKGAVRANVELIE